MQQHADKKFPQFMNNYLNVEQFISKPHLIASFYWMEII